MSESIKAILMISKLLFYFFFDTQTQNKNSKITKTLILREDRTSDSMTSGFVVFTSRIQIPMQSEQKSVPAHEASRFQQDDVKTGVKWATSHVRNV